MKIERKVLSSKTNKKLILGYRTRLTIERSWVRIQPILDGNDVNSHARIDSCCTQSWFIRKVEIKVAKWGTPKKKKKEGFCQMRPLDGQTYANKQLPFSASLHRYHSALYSIQLCGQSYFFFYPIIYRFPDVRTWALISGEEDVFTTTPITTYTHTHTHARRHSHTRTHTRARTHTHTHTITSNKTETCKKGVSGN